MIDDDDVMYCTSSGDWVRDIRDMHRHYGIDEIMSKFDDDKLAKMLEFRIACVREEVRELELAEKPEDVIDALIDICVFAIGTLDSMGVDANRAWSEVLRANMTKCIGVKPGRPNPFCLPDLIKPPGWIPPMHDDNIGHIKPRTPRKES